MKSKFHVTPSGLIAISVAISGMSQAIMILFPHRDFSNVDLAQLTIWQNLSAGLGLFISSITGSIVFARLVESQAIVNSDSSSRPLGRDINSLALIFGVLTVIVAGALFFLFEKVDRLAIGLLLASLFLHFFAALQRNIYAGNANWGVVSLQFGLDGVIRILLIVLVGRLNISGLYPLIFVSLFAQMISILIPTIIKRWRVKTKNMGVDPVEIIKRASPLAISVLGTLVITTLPPFVMGVFRYPDLSIVSVGAMLILIRIPATFVIPIFMPQIRSFALLAIEGKRAAAQKSFRTNLIVVIALGGVVSAATLFVIKLGVNYGLVSKNLDWVPVVGALSVVASISVLLEGFIGASLNSIQHYKIQALIYLSLSAVMILAIGFGPKTSMTALISIVLSSCLASLLLYAASKKLLN